MSHGDNQDRSARQKEPNVDWYNLFAAFKQDPTWEEYFRLRKKIEEVIPDRERRRLQLWDQLDQMAMPLINDRERVHAVCKAFKLELGNRSLDREWYYGRWLRHFALDLIKYAWNLPARPGLHLGFEILKQEDGSSEKLREAADLLEKGEVPPKMSDNDTLALLLWLPAKYFRETEIISLAKQLRQALLDGHDSENSEIEALWKEVAQLLEPNKKTTQKEAEERGEVTPSPSAAIVASASPSPSPAFSQAAQKLLSAWEKAVARFTDIVSEQEAEVAKRDKFISLLQQQISNAEQITQQAREQAETKVKRTLMGLLAEPLDNFQVAAALYEEKEFTLIYESFMQALAELKITPIGEMGGQYTVSEEQLVRSIDGQPVVGQKVEQIGLGWQLQLSDGTVHPLVYPAVRRLKR